MEGKCKGNFKTLAPFGFPKSTVEDKFNPKTLNTRKVTGPDCVPLKVIKFVANVIDSHLCKIIKNLQSCVKNIGKIAQVKKKL